MSEQWNPNQGTDDAVDQTRAKTVDTNAGEDAVMGTVADQPPEDPDNPTLDPDGADDQPAPSKEE